ncbi:hypothetical protein R3P38DRAFT_2800724 [Favolaschia claudopus]|uniref:Uncharacterized protein n=1 Tax=Favolaschia claudopus TaxID=2862362 RepID=A0AAV9ZXT9_9AGAR
MRQRPINDTNVKASSIDSGCACRNQVLGTVKYSRSITQSMEVREKGVKCREELTLLGVRFHAIDFGERASFDSRVASKFLKALLTRGNKGSFWDSGRVPGRNAKPWVEKGYEWNLKSNGHRLGLKGIKLNQIGTGWACIESKWKLKSVKAGLEKLNGFTRNHIRNLILVESTQVKPVNEPKIEGKRLAEKPEIAVPEVQTDRFDASTGFRVRVEKKAGGIDEKSVRDGGKRAVTAAGGLSMFRAASPLLSLIDAMSRFEVSGERSGISVVGVFKAAKWDKLTASCSTAEHGDLVTGRWKREFYGGDARRAPKRLVLSVWRSRGRWAGKGNEVEKVGETYPSSLNQIRPGSEYEATRLEWKFEKMDRAYSKSSGARLADTDATRSQTSWKVLDFEGRLTVNALEISCRLIVKIGRLKMCLAGVERWCWRLFGNSQRARNSKDEVRETQMKKENGRKAYTSKRTAHVLVVVRTAEEVNRDQGLGGGGMDKWKTSPKSMRQRRYERSGTRPLAGSFHAEKGQAVRVAGMRGGRAGWHKQARWQRSDKSSRDHRWVIDAAAAAGLKTTPSL